MKTIEINVKKRETGKGNNRALRLQNRCPGVIYGRQIEAQNFCLDNRDFIKYFNSKNENILIKLKSQDKDLDGKTCLRGDFDTHPLNGHPVHVDLYHVAEDQVVKRKVALKLEGKPKALINGGKFRPILRTINVQAKVCDLPEAIVADISHLDIGDKLKVKDITPPSGVTYTIAENTVAATIDGGTKV